MRRVRVHRDIPVRMPDGVTLLADRYVPAGAERAPVVLIRSPYGRRGLFGLLYGRGFAWHGFQVVMQSCRGGFGSGGDLDPLGHEHDDGLATIAWMREQPWYGGSFAMFGPSYLGFTQWAVAPYAGPDLKAMATQITASQFRDAAYVGGAFALESALSWTTLTEHMGRRFGGAAGLTAPRVTRRAVLSGRPVGELDLASAGRPLRFYRDLLAHHADPAPYWTRRDHSPKVGEVDAAVTMLGGWYDVFLPWQLKDYAALRAAGRRPYLTIGPWYHIDARHIGPSMAESLAWFRAHLLGDVSGLRDQPVRLYVTGAEEWREYPDWPVPGLRRRRWHLQHGFGLGTDGPLESEPDRFRYHPDHPTPVIGGPVLLADSRPRDQRRLEARRDVLVYSSPPLESDLEMIGPVSAELYVRSSTPYADVVVRVCDVHPDGRSMNVCEGVRRLGPLDADTLGDVRRVRVELWPIGHRFRRGHRVRVHVAAGAYPTIARNPGTGDPLTHSGGPMVPSDVEVFHSPDHPSAVIMPLCAPPG
ncbi:MULTISPECIES: CocE/NonD family hydrolase [Nonomuraea]|uniref:CocE/NonD family hydrolase n=1 Tax=Nonomuraea ferruginea TaxID=46174 RepID=A0ABT4SXT8_9ACTN|nr:CocE/NonD family hydrolase [Nonomuraea ferruginea]MDA0641793.1 CocE/NonD family hydrolase [Nonomuraea ferruginea]